MRRRLVRASALLATVLAPVSVSSGAAAQSPTAGAGAECGVPTFDGDVVGDGSGHVRIGTTRGACSDDLEVRCEDDLLVVAHAVMGSESVILHPTDGDVGCDDVHVVRVRVFGGADRVTLPGLDEATGIDGSGGAWAIDVDLGRGADRFAGSRQAEEVDAGPGRDRVLTAAGDDLLLGGPGRDRLFGERGHDFLLGGAGRDDLHGGAGPDCVFQGDRGECGYGGIEPE